MAVSVYNRQPVVVSCVDYKVQSVLCTAQCNDAKPQCSQIRSNTVCQQDWFDDYSSDEWGQWGTNGEYNPWFNRHGISLCFKFKDYSAVSWGEWGLNDEYNIDNACSNNIYDIRVSLGVDSKVIVNNYPLHPDLRPYGYKYGYGPFYNTWEFEAKEAATSAQHKLVNWKGNRFIGRMIRMDECVTDEELEIWNIRYN